jgi:hypothetical protein
VIAIEPLPSNFRYLYRNIRNNGFSGYEVFPMGLASSPVSAVLNGIGTQASSLPQWAQSGLGSNKHIETMCPTTTMDTIVK